MISRSPDALPILFPDLPQLLPDLLHGRTVLPRGSGALERQTQKLLQHILVHAIFQQRVQYLSHVAFIEFLESLRKTELNEMPIIFLVLEAQIKQNFNLLSHCK